MIALEPRFECIPQELVAIDRWVTWAGKKLPYDVSLPNSLASATDPLTWGSFERAQTAYEEGGRLGVGFVLNGDGIVGVDLDGCVHEGQPDPKALTLLDDIGCQYIELSPSGNGLRAFGRAAPPVRCKGQINGIKVELYATQRYLTVTGHTLVNGPIAPLNGFVAASNALQSTEESRRVQRTTEENGCHLQYSSVDIPVHTIPTGKGQRNWCLFELARYCKGHMPDASMDELRHIVKRWHEKAIAVIGTEDFAVSWTDFVRGYEKVQCPSGSVLEEVLRGVEDDPLHSSVERLGYGGNAQLLSKICFRLAAHHEPEPFFLPCRVAGKQLGIDHTVAAKILKSFVIDKLLIEVEKGKGLKASRYRWHSPMT